MSNFKEIKHLDEITASNELEATGLELTAELIAGSRPLFDAFDPLEQGGIGVTPGGQLFEIRHPYWAPEDMNVGARTTFLPYRLAEDGSIIFEGAEYDPAAPTMGAEFEVAVDTIDYKHPWPLAVDGETLLWPDGTSESLAYMRFSPEALVYMVEFESGVARSYEEHKTNVIRANFEVESLFEAYALANASLSLYPWTINDKDISHHPFVQKVNNTVPGLHEFGVMSNQLTMQTKGPEQALYALNEYQAVQAVISLITAAAPIRDGSFKTTVGEHYAAYNKRVEATGGRQIPPEDYAWLDDDLYPQDWRELARAVGSPSSGTFETAAPSEISAFLQRADTQLRNGDIMTSGRTLGWHTDRFREQGRIEICNIGTAGGNLQKLLAAQELVAKYITAKQQEYDSLSPDERKIRHSHHQAMTEIGQYNNIQIALHGKQAIIEDVAGNPTSPDKVLQSMITFTNNFAPEPLSAEAEQELFATLSQAKPSFLTIEDIFSAFFSEASTMTATEALRNAHELEPDMAVEDILSWYSNAKRIHVYTMAYGIGAFEGDEHVLWQTAELITKLDQRTGRHTNFR